MLRAFAPILRPGGRLLVVASAFGSLRRLPAQLHARFDTGAMRLEDVDRTMLAWREAVVERPRRAGGLAGLDQHPLQGGQVAAVRVAARERRAAQVDGDGLVAAVCPGLIDTEASCPWFEDMSEAQTPAEAAVAPCASRSTPWTRASTASSFSSARSSRGADA
jgi:hypothetical protein